MGFGAAVIEASPVLNDGTAPQRIVQLDDRNQHHIGRTTMTDRRNTITDTKRKTDDMNRKCAAMIMRADGIGMNVSVKKIIATTMNCTA